MLLGSFWDDWDVSRIGLLNMEIASITHFKGKLFWVQGIDKICSDC